MNTIQTTGRLTFRLDIADYGQFPRY